MSAHSDHLTLWNAVSRTDPATTKRVNHRGGFTAIGAYHQIKRATEVFGPVGQGWGWTVTDVRTEVQGLVFVHLDLWWTQDADQTPNHFHVLGGAETTQGGNPAQRVDADCIKKALTDGITKGLSYLGFNADVFLGRFDDSRYVEERTREVIDDKLAEIQTALTEAETHAELMSVRAAYADDVATLNGAQRRSLVRLLNTRRTQLALPDAAE